MMVHMMLAYARYDMTWLGMGMGMGMILVLSNGEGRMRTRERLLGLFCKGLKKAIQGLGPVLSLLTTRLRFQVIGFILTFILFGFCEIVTVGTQAAVLAGLDITMFIEFTPAKESEWVSLQSCKVIPRCPQTIQNSLIIIHLHFSLENRMSLSNTYPASSNYFIIQASSLPFVLIFQSLDKPLSSPSLEHHLPSVAQMDP